MSDFPEVKYFYFISYVAERGVFGMCEIYRSRKIENYADISSVKEGIEKVCSIVNVTITNFILLRTEGDTW